MKQPTLLNDGEKKVKNFIDVLTLSCIILLFTLFISFVILFIQHQELKFLKDKVERDGVSMKYYRDLLLNQ